MTSPQTDLTVRELAVQLSGGSVPADTPGLHEQVAAAIGWARSYCGWHVWPQQSEQLVVDGSGSQLLQLPTLHVSAVEAVTEVPDWQGTDPDAEPIALVERRDFTWSATGVLRKRSGVWTHEYRGVTVDLVHGYDAASVEDWLGVIAKAVVRGATLAGGEIARVGAIGFQSTPGAAAAGGSAFLQSEYAVLDRYRLHGVL